MKAIRGAWRPLQWEEFRDELVHDSDQSTRKLPEPIRCSECGAVCTDRLWLTAPAGAREARCPACHRIHDRFPAGDVTLKGTFFSAHRDEVINLARLRQDNEKAEHPLERVVGVENADEGALITTTDSHPARNIGEAVHAACKGELKYQHNKADNVLRVQWTR